MKNTFYGLAAAALVVVGFQVAYADQGYQNITVRYSRGWNLVPVSNTGTFRWQTPDHAEPLASFVYLPSDRMYVEDTSGMTEADLDKFQRNQDYLHLSAKWVYMDGNGSFVYAMKPNMFDVYAPRLRAGWNFIAIPPQLVDGSYTWGNCQVLKAYEWRLQDSSEKLADAVKEWRVISGDSAQLMQAISQGDPGIGLVLKLANDCSLAKASVNAGTPPGLPE